jgi:hypothetical protein
MKMREFRPILLVASLGLTESIQAQWTKEKAAEKVRLEHMTNYQVMAELVQDPRSNLSDSTTQEIIRFAQLDAIAFAQRHRKVSMEEASKIGDSHAQMHQLGNRIGLEAINPVDLTDRTAEWDYAATFFRSLSLISMRLKTLTITRPIKPLTRVTLTRETSRNHNRNQTSLPICPRMLAILKD